MKRPVPVESASALIDEKIKELGDWRGKTLAKVREIIHEADPEILEEWKWMGGSHLVPRRHRLHGRDVQERRQDDISQGSCVETPASTGMPGAPSTSTKATRSMRRP
jgi:hypothetical protein